MWNQGLFTVSYHPITHTPIYNELYLQQSSFVAGRAFQTLLQLPSFHTVNPENTHSPVITAISTRIYSTGEHSFLYPPDVSVLTSDGGVRPRWVQVHVVQRGLLHHVVTPGERQTLHRLAGRGRKMPSQVVALVKTTLYSELNTDLLSCLEIDAFVGSTAHHANLGTFTWTTGDTITCLSELADRQAASRQRYYLRTWQQWWRQSGHSASAPGCSSSPGWRRGLADLCWPTPAASHLK